MRLGALLQAAWWGPRHAWLSALLAPAAALYGALVALRRLIYAAGLRRSESLPVPVVVVGNLVVGGAGKTPVVLALVQALRSAGWTPGVISRGYGGGNRLARAVREQDDPADCGDEPLLIRRRAGAAVWVGADRVRAGRGLCAAHPEVDVIVADDGLQHLRLQRAVDVIVVDGRGLGNGRLLPAGPLRAPAPALPPPGAVVVYNAERPCLAWEGFLMGRRLGPPVPLRAWWQGERAGTSWPRFEGAQPVPAAAGIAEPERFFRMLEQAGLRIQRLPLPDHWPWRSVPWARGTGPVLVTEKDAVKLPPEHPDCARIHVVPLDLAFPAPALARVLAALPARATRAG